MTAALQASHDPAGRIRAALHSVSQALPGLAWRARGARVTLDVRAITAAVFPSGRIVVSPLYLEGCSDDDLAWVLAHELLHLELRSHERGEGDRELMNWAHDAVINAKLELALGRPAPAGAVTVAGAAERSAEAIAAGWILDGTAGERREAVRRPRLALDAPGAKDLLDAEEEERWFPRSVREAPWLQHEAPARSFDLGAGDERKVLLDYEGPVLAAAFRARSEPVGLGRRSLAAMESTLAGLSRRSFHRASRRSGGRVDLVLPGRQHDRATLTFLVNTNGTMVRHLGRALGAISTIAGAVGLEEVRIVQEYAATWRDVRRPVAGLRRHTFLASLVDMPACAGCAERCLAARRRHDLGPALRRLSAEIASRALVVVTTADVRLPDGFAGPVTWVVLGERGSFDPPRGLTIGL